MQTSDAFRNRITQFIRILAVAGLVAGLSSSSATADPRDEKTPPEKPAAGQQATASASRATDQLSPEEVEHRKAWRHFMMLAPKPRKACFEATYPRTEWREVSCTVPPPYPMPPRRGLRPLTVGNGDDLSPQAPTGFISTAIGTFESISGVTNESGPICSGTPVADSYTLQLNTDTFASTACAGSPNPSCQGWEQFVYANDGSNGQAFIQYWLIQYNTTCPAGWNTFSFPSSTDIYCWRNAATATSTVPSQAITNLGNLSLSGTVSATADSVTFSNGTLVRSAPGDNSVAAAAGWQAAEFNIFGNACGSEATFNAGSSIVPRSRIFYGGTAAPNCLAQGFTGETNNLSFGPGAPASSPPGPALFFTESTAGGASSCLLATTVGDTHLATFNGLFYDFQASGDFVLARVDPDFVVQTRQVSGAPTWPNASVNSAVATQMGESKIALCLAQPGGETPALLHVDGKATDLGDGGTISVADRVDITRRSNVYWIVDRNGNSVRAQVYPTWINVSVGLGRWPVTVRGLAANANGNVNQVAASDGAVLTNPFSFDELYHHYADSWRVPARTSLLSVCGKESQEGAPDRPFYAKDLDPKVAEHAKAVCVSAGVKQGVLLDACTLDVAVIGNDAAADVYVGQTEPIAVGAPVVSATGGDRLGTFCWWLLIILVILLVLLLLALTRRRRA